MTDILTPPTLTEVTSPPKHLEDYREIVPEVVDEILELAQPLKDLKVVQVNATSLGGGVAEMLRSVIPLQQDVGLDAKWLVIPPNDAFFEVTKSIHNWMQGKNGDISPEQRKLYLEHNKLIGRLLSYVEADVLIIHDPQPAAALHFYEAPRPKLALWRSHIDTSHPNLNVWNFLLPSLLEYDHYVFTMPDYTNGAFPADRITYISPVIDPLAEKNLIHERSESRRYVEQFGIDSKKPLVTQVSRLDPWKDPKGVIDAFAEAKKQVPDLQLALVAQMASDDPEGAVIQEEVEGYIKSKGTPDIFVLVNLPDNDKAINAFQRGSDVILQKSIREGFGLTITEAMWKGAVVIGGNVGGIRKQIKDGENGFLVDSVEQATEKILYVLRNKDAAEEISRKAHESVKAQFLLPHLVRNYLKVIRQYM